jgi:hypothetical protein
MSDKKIFIALSQREAKSVIMATQFLALGCSEKVGENFIFNQPNAELIGITEEEVYELQDFAERLEQLANEQAELESSIQNPETSNKP